MTDLYAETRDKLLPVDLMHSSAVFGSPFPFVAHKKAHPGRHTDLGNVMLIAEDDDGNYAPISVASTRNEAKEMAESDRRQPHL